MGMTMMLNISATCRGSTRVPTARPRLAPVRAASGVTVSSRGQLTWRCTGVAGMKTASGNTTTAARTACRAPDTTFSSATAQIGSGAITRSSISRV